MQHVLIVLPVGPRNMLVADFERIETQMISLDVPRTMAQTYVALLHHGPSKVSALASALGVSRDDMYRRLSQLEGSGFAFATLTRPVMYAAVPPADVFQILHRQNVRRSEAVLQAQEELEPLLRNFRLAADPAKKGMPFRIINGRERVYENIHELLDNAVREIIVFSSHPASAQLASQAGLWSRIRQRVEAGLKMRILMADTPTERQHAKTIQSPGFEARFHLPERQVNFCIIDGQRMLFFTSRDTSPWLGVGSDSAIITEAPGLVGAQESLFQHIWDNAKTAADARQ